METSNSEAKLAVLHAQNDRWGLEYIETCNSGQKVAVLNAQNHKWGLGPIETRNSGDNHAVLHAHNDRWGLGPIETCNSGPNVSVLHAKTADDGCDPYRPGILVLRRLFCIHKSTGEVWDPLGLVWQTVLFAKMHRWGLGQIETSNSSGKHAVSIAQIHR